MLIGVLTRTPQESLQGTQMFLGFEALSGDGLSKAHALVIVQLSGIYGSKLSKNKVCLCCHKSLTTVLEGLYTLPDWSTGN